MQFSKSVLLSILFATAQASPVKMGNCTVDLTSAEESEISSVISNLQSFANNDSGKRDHSLITRADGIPIVEQVLALLKNSNLANVVIDQVLLHPALLQLSSEATIFILNLNLINYEDLVIAFQKSGLTNQLLLAGLEDPAILPGLLRLTAELLKKNVIGIYLEVNPLPPLEQIIAEHSGKRDTPAKRDVTQKSDTVAPLISKRESQLLNDLFVSLKNSGLVVSVVENLLTNPDLAEPSAQFLINILQSGAIPICDVVHILQENHTIMAIFNGILGDPEILKAFGQLVLDRISNGIIPQDLVNNALQSDS